MKSSKLNNSRRQFLATTSVLALGSALPSDLLSFETEKKKEPIIDIHQHIHYDGRLDDKLIAHQETMGITTTILLPAGRPVNSPSTHDGVSNGLQDQIGGNAENYLFVKNHKKHFRFGACAVPDLPDALFDIEKYIKLGAVVIGELKFGVECDSPEMQKIYQLAEHYDVPVLMHWQYNRYNYGFERFYKMLEQYPKVNFIGHAQYWWANIDKNHTDNSKMYPKGPISPGGLTERYLSDYPNLYGDLSGGSGNNAITRDENYTRIFLEKHQDKLMFGSDCPDEFGIVEPTGQCDGARTIQAIRKFSNNKQIERKLLFENAKKLFKL